MPKAMERKLRDFYSKKGKTGRDLDNAVYGTMNSAGFMKGNQLTDRGRQAERHEARRRANALAKHKKMSREE
jgi:hypothetical protein